MLGWAVCELGFITLMPLGKGETLTYSIMQQQKIITNNNNNNNSYYYYHYYLTVDRFNYEIGIDVLMPKIAYVYTNKTRHKISRK
jgi:hypothetical protein